MKYETIPTTSGVYLSLLFEMSLSVPNLRAQYKMIAMGNIDAKTSDINSKTRNLEKSKTPFLKDNIIHIIKNNGIQIIGGLVIVEI